MASPLPLVQTGTVLARSLGLPGKGEGWDDLPPEYQVRKLTKLARPGHDRYDVFTMRSANGKS